MNVTLANNNKYYSDFDANTLSQMVPELDEGFDGLNLYYHDDERDMEKANVEFAKGMLKLPAAPMKPDDYTGMLYASVQNEFGF